MAYSIKFDTGAEIVLRDTHGKKGQLFLAARPASEEIVSRFGFNVPLKVVGGKLPKTAKVMHDGAEVGSVTLDKGVTQSGNAKVTGVLADVDYNGEPHSLSVRISQPKESTANVLIRSSRPRSGAVHAEL